MNVEEAKEVETKQWDFETDEEDKFDVDESGESEEEEYSDWKTKYPKLYLIPVSRKMRQLTQLERASVFSPGNTKGFFVRVLGTSRATRHSSRVFARYLWNVPLVFLIPRQTLSF